MSGGFVAADLELLDRVRHRLARTGREPSSAAVAVAVRAEWGAPVGEETVRWMLTALRADMVGAGPLEPLLQDSAVTDVLVNGPDDVWVDRGAGLVRAGVRFRDDASVRRLAQRLAAACGRRLDDAQPFVDAHLPDGTRVHAVLPPVCTGGTCLSLRVFRRRAFTVEDLLCAGGLESAGAAVLRSVVAARLAFLVTGGTGSGKTTLLATLLGLVDQHERIVIVEDAGELRPDHPHVVSLEARKANVEGAGEILVRELVRQALRMRPDRLVVGEVRGAEVVDLLTALNTGHDGGAGTVHANTPADVPARLEALGALGGLTRDALHSQLAAAVQCLVHVSRGGRQRRLESVSVLTAPAGLVVPAVAWSRTAAPTPGAPVLRRLLADRGLGAPPGLAC